MTLRTRPALAGLIGLTAILGLAACTSPTAPSTSTTSPPSAASPVETIKMPVGSVPEGIAVDEATGTAYVTSFSDGTVYTVDLLDGTYDELSPATGGASVGILRTDADQLFVAGGTAGTIRVLDAKSGKVLAVYTVPDVEAGALVNDFTILHGVLYATDSSRPVLYRLPLGTNSELPPADAIEMLPLSGITFGQGFNNNGITTTPDGAELIVVQTNTGTLFRVDETTGSATPIALDGLDNVEWGDGLLREGNTLYVVRNMVNTLTVLDLDDAGTSAKLAENITTDDFDSPTTVARYDGRFYLPNARFTLKDSTDADFIISSIPAKG
ncbi:superoxide dismutase [Plantibacter sp. VKM Ac-2885]|uniref:superoxide dismutase n=1 Tax=Plantibacter sp. VKM Ac-2885 TaxID=2783828 RepID=UPI00188CE497|nr:superoxide dismutase [Plantibacter sp. VKM Ac-2885]MBF4514187.1 superoxide dismutase [Plantibacter sp. VKM Ac-2885]